jgi:hypothetical protein
MKTFLAIVIMALLTVSLILGYRYFHNLNLALSLLNGKATHWHSLTFVGQGGHLILDDPESVHYLEVCFTRATEGISGHQGLMGVTYQVEVKFENGSSCEIMMYIDTTPWLVASTKEIDDAGDPRYFTIDLPQPMPKELQSAITALAAAAIAPSPLGGPWPTTGEGKGAGTSRFCAD